MGLYTSALDHEERETLDLNSCPGGATDAEPRRWLMPAGPVEVACDGRRGAEGVARQGWSAASYWRWADV